MYGWRRTIGVIVPSVNTVIESDFHNMADEGINVCVTRILQVGDGKDVGLEMNSYVAHAAEALSTVHPDVVVYGCTAGGVLEGAEYSNTLVATIRGKVECPAFTVFEAILAALQHLAITSIVLATPYSQEIHNLVHNGIEEMGIEITASRGLGIGAPFKIGQVFPEEIYRFATSLWKERNGQAEGLVISCTNFPALKVITDLEHDLGVPVITSNQAAFWRAMKEVALDTKYLDQYGMLFFNEGGE